MGDNQILSKKRFSKHLSYFSYAQSINSLLDNYTQQVEKYYSKRMG